MKYLFIGEQRSPTAIRMGVTWRDKRLAASHLHKAVTAIGISWDDCEFVNIFEDSEDHITGMLAKYNNVIAMGRKVERELVKRDVNHQFIFHPATRGHLRNIDRYKQHVKNQLYEEETGTK